MTPRLTAHLSPEEKRIAVAKACGFDQWVIIKQGLYYREGAHGYTSSLAEAWKLPHADAKKYEMYADRPEVSVNEKVFIERAPLPDYASDLNAMHEAEKVLTEISAEEYQTNLARQYSEDSCEYPAAYYWFHATAAQRFEAFGKALGLW